MTFNNNEKTIPVAYKVIKVQWEGNCLFTELAPVKDKYRTIVHWAGPTILDVKKV